MQIVLMAQARKDLHALPRQNAVRVIRKMEWFASQEDPLSFAKRLTNSALGTYRFRIGDYRVLCDVRHGEITVLEVLAVRDRKKAYWDV